MHIVIGLIVVAVLMGAFVLGARLRETEGPCPQPQDHPRRPATDRPLGEWSEYLRPAAVPLCDHAHRLRPHQMGGRTEPDLPSED
ncbi:DUF6479 family protein [Streptomyces sp. bgisy126]|uniref:DUF6479 family protein n=1 Tax=unclassified Streptomyces TaxID=2593676 RepID=UPI003EBA61E7